MILHSLAADANLFLRLGFIKMFFFYSWVMWKISIGVFMKEKTKRKESRKSAWMDKNKDMAAAQDKCNKH